MARVNCSHNGLAYCILTPIGGDSTMVHCQLGGDQRGETTLEYDPVAIQGWIKSVCGLTCFDFAQVFAKLEVEMTPMLERRHNEEEMRDIRKRFSDGLEMAEDERRNWGEQRSHDEARWRPTEYTLEECAEEASLYIKEGW